MEEARDAMRDAPADVFALDELPRFRRCSAVGKYDHSRAVFVGPRPIRCGVCAVACVHVMDACGA